jgi:hypothetical protein
MVRSSDNSPSRPKLSLAVKSDIQKLVGSWLKPYYRSKTITKDEYTDINRTISRQLYDRVGDVEALELDAKSDLEKTAKEAVEKAVGGLKQKQRMEDSDQVDDSS